jgi:hypothetical protein
MYVYIIYNTTHIHTHMRFTHTCASHTHTHRTIALGVSEDEAGLITRIQLLGPSGGLKPSVRVSGSRNCNCQIVAGSVADAFISQPMQEEHWVYSFVRSVNGLAANYTMSLLRGEGVSVVLNMIAMFISVIVNILTLLRGEGVSVVLHLTAMFIFVIVISAWSGRECHVIFDRNIYFRHSQNRETLLRSEHSHCV